VNEKERKRPRTKPERNRKNEREREKEEPCNREIVERESDKAAVIPENHITIVQF
jgi:hypothetical protein